MTRFLSCSQFGWQKVEKLNQTVAILNVWLRSGSHLNRKRDKTQPDTTKFFLSHYLKSQKKICLALALFGFGPFERFMARVRPNFGSVRLGIFVRETLLSTDVISTCFYKYDVLLYILFFTKM